MKKNAAPWFGAAFFVNAYSYCFPRQPETGDR